jgi:hypothetical protein
MPFAESYGNKKQPIQMHMDRHFPDRHHCEGKCGKSNCDFVGANAKTLIYHNNRVNLPHECATCQKRFAEHKLLKAHIDSDHVRKYQVVGFAEKAGYATDLLTNELPWMAGIQAGDAPPVPTHVKLAEDAAKAIIAARKPDREMKVTWGNVLQSTGGNRGVNPATACDACKASGAKCEHRFDERAPQVAREAIVKKSRCAKCKRIDRHCLHTHEPTPSCVHCGVDCYLCDHQ